MLFKVFMREVLSPRSLVILGHRGSSFSIRIAMEMQILSTSDLDKLMSQDHSIIPQNLSGPECKWRVSLCAHGQLPLKERRILVQCCSLNGGMHQVPPYMVGRILHVVIQPDRFRLQYSICLDRYQHKTPSSWQCRWDENAVEVYVKVLRDLNRHGLQTGNLVVMGESAGVMSATVLVGHLMCNKYAGIAVKSCFFISGAYNGHAAHYFKNWYDGKVAVHVVNHTKDALCPWYEQANFWLEMYGKNLLNITLCLFGEDCRVMFGHQHHNVANFVLSQRAFWDVVSTDQSIMNLDLVREWQYDDLLRVPSIECYSLLWGVRLIAAAWCSLCKPPNLSAETNWQCELMKYLRKCNSTPQINLFYDLTVAPPEIPIASAFLPHFMDALYEGLEQIKITGKTDLRNNEWNVRFLACESNQRASPEKYCMVRFAFKPGPQRCKYLSFKIYNKCFHSSQDDELCEKGVFHAGSILIVQTENKRFTGVVIDSCCRPRSHGKNYHNSLEYFDLIMNWTPEIDSCCIMQIQVIPMSSLMGMSTWFDVYRRNPDLFKSFLPSDNTAFSSPQAAEPYPFLEYALAAVCCLKKEQGPDKVRETLNRMEKSITTCVQGPPGCGKTTHIVAIVECMVRGVLKHRKSEPGSRKSYRILLTASTNQAAGLLARAVDSMLDEDETSGRDVSCSLLVTEKKYLARRRPFKHVVVGKLDPQNPPDLNEVHIVIATVGLLQRPPRPRFDVTRALRGAFDAHVSDEAGQTREMDFFALLSYLKPSVRILLVGDVKQLSSFSACGFRRRSVLAAGTHGSAKQQAVILDRNFRFGSYAAAVHSGLFYGAEGLETASCGISPNIAFIEIDTAHELPDTRMSKPAAYVEKIILNLCRQKYGDSVAYITYYGDQKRLVDPQHPGSARSVDESQGFEADVIILGIGRPTGVGFLVMLERLNVSLSRQKKLLVIVAHKSFMRQSKLPAAIFEIYQMVATRIGTYVRLTARSNVENEIDRLLWRLADTLMLANELPSMVVGEILKNKAHICRQVQGYYAKSVVDDEAVEDHEEIDRMSCSDASSQSSVDGAADAECRIPSFIDNASHGQHSNISGWVVVKILGIDALVQKAGKENDVVESLPFFRKTIHDLLACFLHSEDKGWVRRYLEYTDESYLDSENRLHFIQGYNLNGPKNDKKRKGQETAKIVQHPRPTFREMLDRNSQRLS